MRINAAALLPRGTQFTYANNALVVTVTDLIALPPHQILCFTRVKPRFGWYYGTISIAGQAYDAGRIGGPEDSVIDLNCCGFGGGNVRSVRVDLIWSDMAIYFHLWR